MLTGPGCRQPDYFPLTRNSHWELLFRACEVADGETVEVSRLPGAAQIVAERNEQQLGHYFVMEISRGPTQLYTLFFQRRPAGVFLLLPWLVTDFGSADADWILLLAARPRSGRAWFGNARREQLFEVVGRQTVLVPAGRFADCLRVLVHTAEEAWPGSIWFAPERGPVRWEHRRTRTRDGRVWERIESVELVAP